MSRAVLREELAELAHQQWEHWSRSAAAGGAGATQVEQWQRNWLPYAELDEETKDADRVWADKILDLVARHQSTVATSNEALQDGQD